MKMLRSAILLLALSAGVSAWVSPSSGKESSVSIGRREAFGSVALVGAALLSSQPAFAASQDDIDKANIVKGYKRLVYLLDNWEKETTVCKIGQTTTFGDNCERTPVKVMEYLGYRSTTDPLFKIDKTLMRLGASVPSESDGDFLEATENLIQNAEEASGMAYISSWGESNPGGGKDRVALFIERARNNVIVSKTSLETVIKILDLPM